MSTSSTMWNPSKQITLFSETSPVSQAGSPAKEFQPQAKVQGSPTIEADSGGKCFDSSDPSLHLGSLLKTYLCSELEVQTMSSLHWKKKATPHGREWWVLSMPAHPIEDNASLSSPDWPTPRASPNENRTTKPAPSHGKTHGRVLAGEVLRDWPTPAATPYGSSQNGINGIGGANERPSARTPGLQQLVRMEQWPTPAARDWKDTGPAQGNRKSPNLGTLAHWPTATAGDAKSSGSRNTPSSKAKPGISLTDATRQDGGTGRVDPANPSRDGNRPVLNPDWVETLMGFPLDWSRVSVANASKLWETEWSPKSRMKSPKR
ncbi:MAG: hypothetical protein P8N94_15625 [Gammaproteobacteria bacterium]|nr:hypothetical protein [Gammaproteobacteria bacterium]